MTNVKVEIRGISELNKAFKQIDSDLPKGLKAGFKKLAGRVISNIVSKVPSILGKARGSVKPRATAKGAGIAFGGSAAPYYPWLDFGGSVGRNKSIKRDFIKEGRYVYPTIREMRPEIEDAVEAIVDAVAKGAGFEVR